MSAFRRVAAVMVTLLLVAPAAASAHSSPKYESIFRSLSPNVPGLRLQVLGSDNQYELINQTGKTVVVYGYKNEPYARVLADGTVEVNQRSPATYLNEDRFATTPVPPSANAAAPPVWKVQDKAGRFTWHDHRMHYMASGLPSQVRDRHKKTKIFDYQIPLSVGGRHVMIEGTLYWRGTPKGMPAVAVISLVVVAAVILSTVALVRRRRRVRSAEPRPDVEPGRVGEAW
jgi:hypothetical protein